jgi:hypothetical protein
MTPQESIERRMAALFVAALALIAWQAPRTRPLLSPPFVSTLEDAEQVFPVGVPPDAPPALPSDPAQRLAFLKEHSVDGFERFPAGSCEAFVRMSAHHWLRLPAAEIHRPDMAWLARAGTEVFCP